MERSDNNNVLEYRGVDKDALHRRVLELEDFVERVEANAADTIAMAEELAVAKDQAEAASQRAEDSEAQTRAVLDAVIDAIFTVGATGKIESANASAEDLFGYRAGELIGNNISSYVFAPDGRIAIWSAGAFVTAELEQSDSSTSECSARGMGLLHLQLLAQGQYQVVAGIEP